MGVSTGQPAFTYRDSYVRTQPLAGSRPNLDPDLVARALDLLRNLERAATRLTDTLDVTGFPESERRSDVALLSTLASGLPGVTLHDLVETLRDLASDSGPRALFPGSEDLSIPDEARELLYLFEPLWAVASGRQRLPRHAGERLRAAPLAFCLTQPKTRTALAEVLQILYSLMQTPLALPQLTTIRPARQPRPSRQPPQPPQPSTPARPDPRTAPLTAPISTPLTMREISAARAAPSSRGASAIMLGALVFAVLIIVTVVSLSTDGTLPFGLDPTIFLP